VADVASPITVVNDYKTPSSGLLYPSSQATIKTTFQRLDLSPSSGQSKNIKYKIGPVTETSSF
jgi:hypothetical protein